MLKDNKPILLFKGDTEICYGILCTFSLKLRDALISIGEEVQFFDPLKDNISDCIGKEYKAVIGFMETFFYNHISTQDTMLFDLIKGPKFNYWPDHPSVFYNHIQRVPKDFYVLTQDRNYVKFINRYYKNITAFFLPLGGSYVKEFIPFADRKYEISFVGSYLDWRDGINSFSSEDPTTRIIRDTYVNLLIEEPDLTAENAFEKVLKLLNANVTEEQFLKELVKVHQLADRGVSRLYREEIVKTILDAGYAVDVFGDRWNNSPYAGNPNLKIHKEIAASEVQEIYKNSKISLNIMTWHKDSITERVLDSMAAGSIVLTDTTPALEECFKKYPSDNAEILLFSLKRIKEIPSLIDKCLNDESIAHRGKKRVEEEYMWTNHAKRLIRILDDLNRHINK